MLDKTKLYEKFIFASERSVFVGGGSEAYVNHDIYTRFVLNNQPNWTGTALALKNMHMVSKHDIVKVIPAKVILRDFKDAGLHHLESAVAPCMPVIITSSSLSEKFNDKNGFKWFNGKDYEHIYPQYKITGVYTVDFPIEDIQKWLLAPET